MLIDTIRELFPDLPVHVGTPAPPGPRSRLAPPVFRNEDEMRAWCARAHRDLPKLNIEPPFRPVGVYVNTQLIPGRTSDPWPCLIYTVDVALAQ